MYSDPTYALAIATLQTTAVATEHAHAPPSIAADGRPTTARVHHQDHARRCH